MPIFEAGDVLRVPFPYTDRTTLQRRPALVFSKQPVGSTKRLVWVMMITSADNRGWPEDLLIEDPSDVTGLPIPSIIRVAKIATIERDSGERIGRVLPETLEQTATTLRRLAI